MDLENVTEYSKLVVDDDSYINIDVQKIVDPTKPIYYSYNNNIFSVTFFDKCSNQELKNFLFERKIKSNYNRKKLIELCNKYTNNDKISDKYYISNNDFSDYGFVICYTFIISLIFIFFFLLGIMYLYRH